MPLSARCWASMRHELRPLAVAAIAFAAIAIPARLVWQTLPPPNGYDTVAGEFGATTPVPLVPDGTGQRRLTVDAPDLSDLREVEIGVKVATYTRPPSQTIRLDLLGPRSKLLRTCRIPPASYTDNGTVACPIARPDQVRRIRIAVHGPRFALYAADEGGRLVAGTLVQAHHFRGLRARVDALRERIGVTRPGLVAPILLFVALTASIALMGAALLMTIARE